MKSFVKHYLTFSPKERTGAIILLIIIAIVAILPFVKPTTKKTAAADSAWLIAASQLQASQPGQYSLYAPDGNTHYSQYDQTDDHYENIAKGQLFNFDPNNLDGAGFKKLGLRDKTIRTLLNYRSKGGKFRSPDDLQKIYGLRPEEFERLRPYISIASTVNQYHFQQTTSPRNFEDRPQYKPRVIDINTADTTAFKSLYGIGSRLAARIISFREKLGGFYNISQVGETYGIPDSTFQKINPYLRLGVPSVKMININTANYEELNNHPYISSKLAYLILKQRKEKGNFTSINEIATLAAQTTDVFEKIAHYISVI